MKTGRQTHRERENERVKTNREKEREREEEKQQKLAYGAECGFDFDLCKAPSGGRLLLIH